MKHITLLLLSFFAYNFVAAQCTPDPRYISLGVGVYPAPDTASTALPLGCDITLGFNSALASINQPYNFTLTAVVPTEVPFNGQMVPLTYVQITNITGLPPGMTYVCNPGNCTFNGGTNGCILITGTPTAAGEYSLSVTTTVRVGNLINSTQHFPSIAGDPLTITGEYKIRVDAPPTCPPNGIVSYTSTKGFSVSQNQPNPFDLNTRISINSDKNTTYRFTVTNIVGKTVESRVINAPQGEYTHEFDGSVLPAGIYTYTLSNGTNSVSRKMIIK